MPVRRKKNGRWFYRKLIKMPDGSRQDISGMPTLNTKLEAERAEREHIERALAAARQPRRRNKRGAAIQ
jgi:hypothetical protein